MKTLVWSILALSIWAGSCFHRPTPKWQMFIDDLFNYICQVESGGNRFAWNRSEDAVGIAQIRRCVVDDVNRILGRQEFTYGDRWDPCKSRRMFRVYIIHYTDRYTRLTGKPATVGVAARIWNGGPDGWKKKVTDEYVKKLEQTLKANGVL